MNKVDLVDISYIGCGCNKSPQIVDWFENNLICFGVCNAVAIYDPKQGRIIFTLSEHKDKVNAVKWIRGKSDSKNELISASTDSTVIIWLVKLAKDISFEVVSKLVGHKGSVHAVDGKYNNDNETIIVSAGSDCTVRVWCRKDESDFSCIKVIDLERSLAFSLDLLVIENIKSCLLAFGTDAPELVFYAVGTTPESINHLIKVHGHEDWIRSISMNKLKNGDIFVASSGQDMMIRVLRLSQRNDEINTDFFYLKKEELLIDGLIYYLSLETVLYGHEGWIYSVDWLQTIENDDSCCLLTASFDRTVVVWKPCPVSGVWIEESRMGEMGGDNSLGYYGGKFSPDGKSVIAHSYQGSFHIWVRREDKWVASFVLGGHSDAVMDLCWEENGHYLLTVSSDKTTRLHVPSKIHDNSQNTWFELSRPQIHGHALSSVTSLKQLKFASCSEEKVIRVFETSDIVFKLLTLYLPDLVLSRQNNATPLPSVGSITALGLSNKAVYETENLANIRSLSTLTLNEFPKSDINEDFLIQHTLWPESMKLYGHGNDVFTVASSHDGKILASSAKATNAEQAKILLWDTETWKIIDKLEGHQLTVTQMEFSPSDTYLLSVSRDRRWCLYKKNENKYELEKVSEKNSHSRIIWSCSWSLDELYFITGSRDCKAIVWENGKAVSSLISEKGSVTAVSFGPIIDNENYLVALGHECGDIVVYLWSLNEWSLLTLIPKYLTHHLTVQRLSFRPVKKNKALSNEKNIVQFASCSLDFSVRIFNLYLDKLKGSLVK